MAVLVPMASVLSMPCSACNIFLIFALTLNKWYTCFRFPLPLCLSHLLQSFSFSLCVYVFSSSSSSQKLSAYTGVELSLTELNRTKLSTTLRPNVRKRSGSTLWRIKFVKDVIYYLHFASKTVNQRWSWLPWVEYNANMFNKL